MNNHAFTPPLYLKHTYLQTILASNKIRVLGNNPMVNAEKEIILDAGNGIRLQGFLSRQPKETSKGIVILLHGWEGSNRSAYILSTGKYLFQNGYSIFRLNFRDHGESHHLNEGLFYAIILDEIFTSAKQAAAMENGKPAFIIGFSLGGNFALRIAKKCVAEKIDYLSHIVAVSPGLNPELSTDAIDNDQLLKWYFLRKWRRSLLKKEELFPHIYKFGELLKIPSVRKMTDLFLERYSNYGGTLEYFKGYTLTGNYLEDIPIPTTIITSQDDPIIPVNDFNQLKLNNISNLIITRYGGHNGFIEKIPFSCWYERIALEIFNSHLN